VVKLPKHKGGKMGYPPLSEREEQIARLIMDAAYTVHKAPGPGLLESVYEPCFCHELGKRGLAYQRQVIVPIVYDGVKLDEGFRLDVLVEDNNLRAFVSSW
jgi:GxxExxY protein